MTMITNMPANRAQAEKSSGKPLLQLASVSSGYGEVPVLAGVSLDIHEGAIVALIGANGAGKSTTLRTISGLIRPTAGTITYDGRDITGQAVERIVADGLVHVPEGRKLFCSMTVLENLLVGSAMPHVRVKRKERLDYVFGILPRLFERQNQLAGTLSGGEQQMVAIARGLMACPRLLMLDETSLGLAPVVVEAVFRVIEELKASGLTILLVEQNTALALDIADHAFALEHGHVVIEGPAKELAKDDRIRKAYLGV